MRCGEAYGMGLWIGAGFVILLLAVAYRLCRTAAGADRQTERDARQWKEEHHGK